MATSSPPPPPPPPPPPLPPPPPPRFAPRSHVYDVSVPPLPHTRRFSAPIRTTRSPRPPRHAQILSPSPCCHYQTGALLTAPVQPPLLSPPPTSVCLHAACPSASVPSPPPPPPSLPPHPPPPLFLAPLPPPSSPPSFFPPCAFALVPNACQGVTTCLHNWIYGAPGLRGCVAVSRSLTHSLKLSSPVQVCVVSVAFV